MTDKKRDPPPASDMELEDTSARQAQTDPNEIADALEQARRDEEDVDRYVAERERSIGRGVRRAAKRFRL